ncbi:hypothetical protein [Endozoicomonas elysicola]|uniref:Uncharacterized protein n=1 Tax=Endozoicomonas elysicola TaxID=305900 RepID=A0A081K8G3_9GAMM|nr:hypothetical protein [Endozoicomonas elysicola]KEI70439.1 hypothetical protein GV64_06550 [Endozoicomonas elysicola]
MICFNNCQGFTKEQNYGADYSIWATDYFKYRHKIRKGAAAVIIDKLEDGTYSKKVIKITEFGQAVDPETKREVVTIDGDLHSQGIYTKAELSLDKMTSRMFDKNGNFLRKSVI